MEFVRRQMGFRKIIGIVLLVPVCTSSAWPGPNDFPVTIKDALGFVVILSRPPQRIVSMAPSITEILFAVGAGDEVVGVTEYCDYPNDAQSRTKVGGFANPSLEKIVSLKSSLVLAARHNPMTVIDGLRQLQVPVFALNPSSLDEVLDAIGIVGRLTGHTLESDSLISDLGGRVRKIEAVVRDRSEKPRVLWGKIDAPTYTAGPGSFIGNLIDIAGGDNVASDAGVAWPLFGLEAIVAKNPDVIITSTGSPEKIPEIIQKMSETEGWREVTAIKRKAVIFVDLNLIGRPGPRIVDGLEAIARAIHPELFSDRDGN